MSILTTPERLAKCLIDCHSSIVAGYHLTQEAIDQIERPCWLVFIEDMSFENTTVDQEQVSQSYSVAYIGHPFNAGISSEFVREYELQARAVAEAAVSYLLAHPQLQFSDTRGLFPSEDKHGLAGVTQNTLDSRSAITLYQRDAVEGDAFWGFTIEMTCKEQIMYETVGF